MLQVCNYFITCVELVGEMVLVFGSEVSGFLVAIVLRTVFSSTTAAFLNATGTPSKDLNKGMKEGNRIMSEMENSL